MGIVNILGYVIIGIGVLFMIIGTIGIMQPKKDFYYRVLVACKVDTVGIITLAIGMALRHGFSFFTGKLFLLVIIMLVLNPLVAHMMASSAHESGYVPDCENPELEQKDE